MRELLTKFDKLMAAVTFAEANAPELGEEFQGPRQGGGKMASKGVKHEDRGIVSDKRAHAGVH